jgi:hypothetical protein
MRAAFETGFRYDNRVMLSDARDRLGRRRVCIEWQIGEADVENMRRVTQLFDQAVRQAGAAIWSELSDAPAVWRQARGRQHHGNHPDARRPMASDENSWSTVRRTCSSPAARLPEGGTRTDASMPRWRLDWGYLRVVCR